MKKGDTVCDIKESHIPYIYFKERKQDFYSRLQMAMLKYDCRIWRPDGKLYVAIYKDLALTRCVLTEISINFKLKFDDEI